MIQNVTYRAYSSNAYGSSRANVRANKTNEIAFCAKTIKADEYATALRGILKDAIDNSMTTTASSEDLLNVYANKIAGVLQEAGGISSEQIAKHLYKPVKKSV